MAARMDIAAQEDKVRQSIAYWEAAAASALFDAMVRFQLEVRLRVQGAGGGGGGASGAGGKAGEGGARHGVTIREG